MNSILSWTSVVVLLLASVTVGVGAGTDAGRQDGEKPIEVTSSDDIVYNIDFYKEQSIVVIKYQSISQYDVATGYSLEIDDQTINQSRLSIDEGETGKRTINITSGINVNQDDHSIRFSTYGNSTYLNFTREIDSANTGQVPVTHIENVTVRDGKYRGQPATVADITLANPSDQIYSTKLFVHTTETDGRHKAASVRPGDTRTITVKLNEKPGTKVAGEARLFTGNLTQKEGAFDQIEFVGQAGGETSTWDRSYDPVKPTWMDDHYRYENDSVRQSFGERVSGGHEIQNVPIAYLAVAFLGAALVVLKLR